MSVMSNTKETKKSSMIQPSISTYAVKEAAAETAETAETAGTADAESLMPFLDHYNSTVDQVEYNIHQADGPAFALAPATIINDQQTYYCVIPSATSKSGYEFVRTSLFDRHVNDLYLDPNVKKFYTANNHQELSLMQVKLALSLRESETVNSSLPKLISVIAWQAPSADKKTTSLGSVLCVFRIEAKSLSVSAERVCCAASDSGITPEKDFDALVDVDILLRFPKYREAIITVVDKIAMVRLRQKREEREQQWQREHQKQRELQRDDDEDWNNYRYKEWQILPNGYWVRR